MRRYHVPLGEVAQRPQLDRVAADASAALPGPVTPPLVERVEHGVVEIVLEEAGKKNSICVTRYI